MSNKRNRRAGRSNQTVKAAQAKVERALTSTSKQPRFGAKKDVQLLFQSIFKWAKDELQTEPAYSIDSRKRDTWLSKVWKKEPHIAGIVSSVVSIDTNRAWWLSGGRNQVNRYNAILRGAEGGAGWRQYMASGPLSYYTSDMGMISEVARDGSPTGPLRDLFNVDSSRCYLTSNIETPLAYIPENGKEQRWLPTDFFRVMDMPSTDEAYRKLGFCALSRAIQLVQLMVAVYEHDKEMLLAKAPKGLLLLQNISESQWDGAMTARKADLTSREQELFAGVSVLAQEGIDQIDAKLIALSQLPANFDIEVFTNLLMYGLGLVFKYDAREFWPVSQGSLGTGKETEIQHVKATGKGGLSFILSYQDQLQQELPDTLEFEFEQRDIQGEMIEAQVKKAWADVAAVLYDKGQGPLQVDEVRMWLADAGVIPAEWATMTDEVTAESSGEVSGVQRSKRNKPAESRMAWAEHEHFWASAFRFPTEPIVRCNHLGKTQYLFSSGYEFLYENKRHKMARAMAYEYGGYNAEIARGLFGHSYQVLQPAQLTVSRAAKILYEKGDVEITEDDVKTAVEEAGDRIGPEFAAMLQAG